MAFALAEEGPGARCEECGRAQAGRTARSSDPFGQPQLLHGGTPLGHPHDSVTVISVHLPQKAPPVFHSLALWMQLFALILNINHSKLQGELSHFPVI